MLDEDDDNFHETKHEFRNARIFGGGGGDTQKFNTMQKIA